MLKYEFEIEMNTPNLIIYIFYHWVIYLHLLIYEVSNNSNTVYLFTLKILTTKLKKPKT